MMLGRETDEEGKVKTHVDLLIYGRSKVGKTRLASTAPNPFVIAADPSGHKAFPYSVPGMIPTATEDMTAVESIVHTLLYFYTHDHPYDTLVLDGLTFLHDLFMREIGLEFKRRGKSADPDLLGWDQRTKILRQYKDILRRGIGLTQLPDPNRRMHFICTTLEESIKDDPEAPFQIRPLFGTRSMNDDYPSLFTTICYLTIDENTKENEPVSDRISLFTQLPGGILAGDRLDMFPPTVKNCNLSDYLYTKPQERERKGNK